MSTHNDSPPIYFYGRDSEHGYLSQMFVSKFDHDGVAYPTTEHFFQAAKARKFGDIASLDAILANPDPFAAKRRGSTVKKFNRDEWSKVAFDIVVEANYLKFTKSEFAVPLAKRLIGTGDCTLGEASPKDHVWGMGCTANIARVRGQFPGKNLLGRALEDVRVVLREEAEEAAELAQARRQVLGG